MQEELERLPHEELMAKAVLNWRVPDIADIASARDPHP
jgi:hypothetical protein